MKKPNRFKLDLQLFAEDQKEAKPEEQKVDPEKNYAKAISELKASTVPKEEYKKLEEQNKQLLDAIINGNGVHDEHEESSHESSIEELQRDLYIDKKKMTNLEYWSKTLLLRRKLMEQGETDPMTPAGHKVQATATDYLTAENVANGIQECIDASGGDPELFNSELRRRGLDILPKV